MQSNRNKRALDLVSSIFKELAQIIILISFNIGSFVCYIRAILLLNTTSHGLKIVKIYHKYVPQELERNFL